MKKLSIYNFKCFQNVTIKLNQLNVFAGVNGAGKSTVIQSILLADEAVSQKSKKEMVSLNETYGMTLGTSANILNQDSGDNIIKMSLDSDRGLIWSVDFDIDTQEEQLGLHFSEVKEDKELKYESLHFLGAERLGPRVAQPIVQMETLNVGVQGEYTAQVIGSKSGREKVRKECMYPNSKDPNLPAQVNLWLNSILPGVKISANIDYRNLCAQVRIENGYSSVNPLLATNIGFGISYVLPVITMGLIAPKNSLVIIENPEAHLHPSAQSEIGKFLAMIAMSGVMVIVETHSEHIINGIQIYVAEHPEFSSSVIINNFSSDDTFTQPKVDSISISERGEIEKWPKGFMDQAQIDYMALNKIQRGI